MGVVTDVLVFSAPGVFFVIWVLLGMPAEGGSGNVWPIGLGAVAVSVLALGYGRDRQQRASGRRAGRVAQRCANAFRRLPASPDSPNGPTVHRAEDATLGSSRTRSRPYRLHLRRLPAQRAPVRLLHLGLRHPPQRPPAVAGSMLYSVGRIATVVNLTPGGVGVAEVAYTAVYVAVLGEAGRKIVPRLRVPRPDLCAPMFTGRCPT